jgi:hypothetical protein
MGEDYSLSRMRDLRRIRKTVSDQVTIEIRIDSRFSSNT